MVVNRAVQPVLNTVAMSSTWTWRAAAHATESGHPVLVQQKAEREARLADKKAKKEEERRKKFAKKVSLSLASAGREVGRLGKSGQGRFLHRCNAILG